MKKSLKTGTTNEQNRYEWVKKILVEIPSGQRILDAGAGQLKYRDLCQHLNYVSQDFAKYDGNGNGSALQTKNWKQNNLDIISDITSIPEPDASFDAVMCIEVLEHLPDPVDALREMIRLLKTGGLLILTAPFSSLTHYAPFFYQTGYSRYFYEYWLSKLGLEVIEMDWNGNYFEYLAQELRRLPSIGKRYSSLHPNWFQKQAIRIILYFLDRLSRSDTGSNELLCYGLHIKSRKK